MKKRLLLGLLFLVVLTACAPKETTSKYSQDVVDELAQCLTENDVVMYGAFWCPHCINSKAKFGPSFGHINYIECDARCKPDEDGKILSACKGYEGQPELCIEREIEGYDTWIFGDGSRAAGEPSLELLDERSGCNILPKEQ